MKTLTMSLLCGFIFGLGLIVSGMSNPARVLNFLDWGHRWDATLALVMGGAIAVALPGFYWVRKRHAPLFTDKFDIPVNRTIDAKLIFGASTFGIGWGIGGFCPGPSIVAAATLQPDVLLFIIAMLIGMLIQHWFSARVLAPDG
ncbi:membrane protein [Arsukibacterium sp. MJ3]|jgi:hypothetical protein|uniref:DUF6691 family protein n=1 Tax=Arsukibacterium sp. MJ3 TaxID=1632859 RepID=UPI0006273FD9|nr:DUF6691 family protein [Arsukibacterium sp. MJ3]KKO50362.1 membrane protein [Arsukibacterium sp. MJ3]